MKYGLGESYGKVLVSKKLRGYLDLTKPASSVGAFMTFLVASLFFYYYTGQEAAIGGNLFRVFYSSFVIFLAHGASQSLNMAEDAEMDRDTPHKQNRPIPSGIVSEEEARSITWFTGGFALGTAFTVSTVFGFMVMVLLWFGIFYNLDPIRAKERIIGVPWQAVSRGLLPFPTVWAAHGDILSITPWLLGLFMFFYVMGFQNSADIIDREVDREHGVRTFVVEYGVGGTIQIATACVGAMAVLIGFSTVLGLLPYKMLWLLAVMPMCAAMLYYMWEYPYHVSEISGNHPSWIYFYMGMVICVTVPLSVEIAIAGF